MFFFAVDCWAYRSHYCSNQGKSTLQAKEDTSPDTDTNCSADNLADPYSDNSESQLGTPKQVDAIFVALLILE